MVNKFLKIIKKKFKDINIIERYVVSEFFSIFSLIILAGVIVGTIDIVYTLIDMFINNGVPFIIVLKLLVFKIPAVMILFFPLSALGAALVVLIKMSIDSEIVVLRAGGFSLFRIVRPIVIAGVLTTLLAFIIGERVAPYANRVSDELLRKVVLKKPSPDLIENTFFKESNERYFYVNKLSKDKTEMEKIVIYEMSKDYPRVIIAKNATWNGKEWNLRSGTVHKYDADGLVSYQGRFDNMKIHVDSEIHKYYKSQKSPREMSSNELREKIKDLKSSGVEATSLSVDYYLKYSKSFACFVFTLLGAGLVFTFVRSGKDIWGVVFASVLGVLSFGFYFTSQAIFRALGRGAYIPPMLVAWGPVFLFGVAGVWLIVYHSNKR